MSDNRTPSLSINLNVDPEKFLALFGGTIEDGKWVPPTYPKEIPVVHVNAAKCENPQKLAQDYLKEIESMKDTPQYGSENQ